MRLRGWKAVVTGASSGIGAAAARAFAKEGAAVALGARSAKTLESLASEIRRAGGRAEPIVLDVTKEESVRAFAATVRERFGEVDVLLNNAGVGIGGKLLETSTADWDETMATNLRGAFLVLRELVPWMLDPPASHLPRTVVNVASVVGTIPGPRLPAYAASKWGLRGLSLSAALEVADRGVRVLSLNPGYVDTPMTSDASVPRQDMMTADELAETIVRLVTLPAGVQIDDVTVYPHRLYTD